MHYWLGISSINQFKCSSRNTWLAKPLRSQVLTCTLYKHKVQGKTIKSSMLNAAETWIIILTCMFRIYSIRSLSRTAFHVCKSDWNVLSPENGHLDPLIFISSNILTCSAYLGTFLKYRSRRRICPSSAILISKRTRAYVPSNLAFCTSPSTIYLIKWNFGDTLI